MRSCLFCFHVTALLSSLPVDAAAQPELVWSATADGRWHEQDYLWNLDVHEATGMVVVAGESWGDPPTVPDYAGDFLTAAFDADGNLAWTRSWGTDEYPWNFAWQMALDQQNGVVVTSGEVWLRDQGTRVSPNDYLAVAYDLSGQTLFESIYVPTAPWNRQEGLVHNPVTGSFLSGMSDSGIDAVVWHGNGSYATLAEPPSATEGWTWDVAVDATGGSYVTGKLSTGAFYVSAYDVAGDLSWHTQRSPGSYSWVHPERILHGSTTGTTFVLLRAYTATGTNAVVVMAFAADGSELWSRELPLGAAAQFMPHISHDALNDRVVVSRTLAGYSSTYSLIAQAFVTALDASDGALIWDSVHGDPNGSTVVNDLTLDASGNSYLVGLTRAPDATSNEGVLLSFDDAGALRWSIPVVVGTTFVRPSVVHVDGRLNVYVGGTTCAEWCPLSDEDFAVVKFSQIPTVDAVAADVQDLVASGTLTHGEGRALLSMLDVAAASIDRNDPQAAAGQLNAFVESTRALELSARLDPRDADALTVAAESVADSL